MLPARIAKYGREILGDMLACPKKRCKAVLASRKGYYDFHFIVRLRLTEGTGDAGRH